MSQTLTKVGIGRGKETWSMSSLFHLLIPVAIISIALGSLLWMPNAVSAVDRQSIIYELWRLCG